MEYVGTQQTHTAAASTYAYRTARTPAGAAIITPLSLACPRPASYVDSYPAPSPCRRSLTTVQRRPVIYYCTRSAKATPPGAAAGEAGAPPAGPLSSENRFSTADDILTPSLFASNRNALYTRYTRADWKRNAAIEAAACDAARRLGESVRLDAHRLAHELDDRQKATRLHTDQLLASRLGDIQFWKGEISHEIDSMVRSIDDLGRAKKEVERFVADSDNQLCVARECLYQREKRHAIDLVHDDVESELVKEVDAVKQAQIALRSLLDRLEAQLQLNRAAQHELEKDVKAKHTAAVIDSAALGTRETSRGLALRPGVERVDNSATVPETWAELADGLLSRSQSQRSAARDLLADAQRALNAWAELLRRQWDAVNAALASRAREIREARDRVQRRLAAVLQDAADTERDAEFLRRAAEDKRNPMKVAHTRLEMRLHRPGAEACRDSAQQRMVQETRELDEALVALAARSSDLDAALQRLLHARSTLEQDLATKNYSLFVDQEKCLGMRKTYPVPEKVYCLV